MYLREVVTKKEKALFLNFPDEIHKDNAAYIRPLDKDIEAVFDPQKNKFFQNGKCTRWLLFNKNNQAIGRIAAFINRQYLQEQPTGGIGFFDCTDDQNAANAMFDFCKKWLENQGMQAMDGPINFGERINWWGLLVEGFQSPLYGMNYHPPYYRKLFENYGFKIHYQQNCYNYDLTATLPKKFYRLKELAEANNVFELRHISKKHIDKFAKDFAAIYNKAWASHGEGKSIEEKEAVKLFREMKAVIDEQTIWFAYHNNQPIGCWLNLPDLNDYFKQLKPRLNLSALLKFLWLKKYRPTNKLVGVLFGIVPGFQNKGIDAYLIVKGLEAIAATKKYSRYEMQWIGDFNPKMINVAQNMGAQNSRKFATFRLMFGNKHTDISGRILNKVQAAETLAGRHSSIIS